MPSNGSTYRFAGAASPPKNALALIYDLEGFSTFFNQPDVQHYVPAFLNHVSAAVGVVLFGGDQYWIDGGKSAAPLKLRVAHEKFIGDGGLYVLLPPVGQPDFNPSTLHALCNRLWNLKTFFNRVVKGALSQVPVYEIPRRIRFGLSRGSVYELKRPNTSAREYIGFCINQASRLQDYCGELGFVASARLMISDDDLRKYGYKKVVATRIKGFPNEIVIVDSKEYDKLSQDTKVALFKELK